MALFFSEGELSRELLCRAEAPNRVVRGLHKEVPANVCCQERRHLSTAKLAMLGKLNMECLKYMYVWRIQRTAKFEDRLVAGENAPPVA